MGGHPIGVHTFLKGAKKMSLTLVMRNEVVAVPVKVLMPVEVEIDKEALLDELAITAKEIRHLRSALNVISSVSDPFTYERICIRLDAREQEYFLMFNQYRMACGFERLEGKKFTGNEHRYESALF